MAYPEYSAYQTRDYFSTRQPISGFSLGYRAEIVWSVLMITGPNCKGYLSRQRYKNYKTANRAAKRKEKLKNE